MDIIVIVTDKGELELSENNGHESLLFATIQNIYKVFNFLYQY